MANFADSNRTAVRYVEESTWGTTPSGPNMKALNITSESLKSNINTVTSDTIRSDRNVSDITQVGGGASGDIGFELRYGDIDDLIAGAMQSAWVTTRVSTGVASAMASGATIQADSSALNAIVSGQFVRLSGSSATANDGDYRVTAVSTTGSNTKIYLADASSGATASLTTDVFTTGTLLQGKMIRNGTTKRSYTVEKEFADVSSVARYPGMRVTTFSMNFESQSILTGTIGFSGKGQISASATIASAITPASTNEVMNASGNVGRIWEGGQAVTGIAFQSISIELNNNPRDQAKVGSDQLAGIGTGRCEVTGSLTAYFENNALLDKFTNGTKSSFRTQITDSNGRSYIVTLPRITYTDFTVTAGGPNADIMQEGSFGAAVDVTGKYAIQIDALD